MDRFKILVFRAIRFAARVCAMARQLCRTERCTETLLRAKEESEMAISMRDLQQLVSRQGDSIRPSGALWESKGLRGPSRFC